MSDDDKPVFRPAPGERWDDTMTGSLAMPMGDRWLRAVNQAVSARVEGPPQGLEPGVSLGRWTLVGKIGRGGAAEVWIGCRERARGGREVVALKVILAHLARDKGFVRMFLDEARFLADMQHPNIVRIIDVGSEEGLPFVALEFVLGDSLGALMASLEAGGDRMPLGAALRIMGEACLGLHVAHELRDEVGRPIGVVHRDVSPPNVMLSGSGDVKLIDFGIAKAVDRLAEQTRTGVMKGKVDYMSPEQARGDPVDARSDIWSAGAVLYELVCGRMAYDGGMLEVYAALKHGQPPLAPPPDVPEPVVQVLGKALAVDVNERFQTAADLRRGIQYAFAKCCQPFGKPELAGFFSSHLSETLTERTLQYESAVQFPIR